MSSRKNARRSRSSTAVSKPTPAELVRICNDIPGLGLFGALLDAEVRQRIDRASRTEKPIAYQALVKQLTTGSIEDRLRLALTLWMRGTAVAACVLDDTVAPPRFSSDLRMEIRWRRSRGVSVPKAMDDYVELLWKHAFPARPPAIFPCGAPPGKFKTKKRLYAAFRKFGCRTALLKSRNLSKEEVKRLGELNQQYEPEVLALWVNAPEAVKQLAELNKQWLKAQNADRSARRRKRSRTKVRQSQTER